MDECITQTDQTNVDDLFNTIDTTEDVEKKVMNVKVTDNNTITYFSYNILNDQNPDYKLLNVLNFISYCNNIFVYNNDQLSNAEFDIRYDSCERDILYVRKPSTGSRIYIAIFNVNCDTEYVTHLDCDSDINLYEDKIMSLFVKCKSVEFDEEGKLIGIPFSEEVTKKELPENVMNNLINMKFSEDDMIIRFTINSDGEITNSNLIFMMETEEEEEQEGEK